MFEIMKLIFSPSFNPAFTLTFLAFSGTFCMEELQDAG